MTRWEMIATHIGNPTPYLRKDIESLLDDYAAEKDKEIERLKGLIEKAYWAGQGQATETLMIAAGDDDYRNDKAKTLKEFQTENNLQPKQEGE